MSEWEKRIDDERDEQDIRIRLMKLSLAVEKYESIPKEDLESRKEVLKTIDEACDGLLLYLDENDDRVTEVNIRKNWTTIETIKVTEAMIEKAKKEKENGRDDR